MIRIVNLTSRNALIVYTRVVLHKVTSNTPDLKHRHCQRVQYTRIISVLFQNFHISYMMMKLYQILFVDDNGLNTFKNTPY